MKSLVNPFKRILVKRILELHPQLRELWEALRSSEFDWVNERALRVSVKKPGFEYKITVECETDQACSRLREKLRELRALIVSG